jgi:predicted DNA-binding transcriptional regulator AlpA
MHTNADDLIRQLLGSRYEGRRYLRYAELKALGLCANRTSLTNWMATGAFPRAIKIPGPRGQTLVWLASEVAQHIADRVRERDSSTQAKQVTDARAALPARMFLDGRQHSKRRVVEP